MKDTTTFKKGVKLVALLQATLEQMDEVKGTALDKQRTKQLMRQLERSIEKDIRGPLKALDNADSTMLTTIQGNIEMVLDLNLDEIAVLKKEVVELRDADPFGEHFDINPNAAKAK
jgi:light-regulated signal transduction histidine kinase (bacteriophytochrome)